MTRELTPADILTRDELTRAVRDLKRKRRYQSNRLNLAIVRLATFAGLRVAEIQSLNLVDVRLDSERPVVSVLGKGGKPRQVPLWWCASALVDLKAWKDERLTMGAKPSDPFICRLSTGCNLPCRVFSSDRLSIRAIQLRWANAIKCLGSERAKALSIHHGRHTFISHALASGVNVVSVRDAAGHSSLSTTNIYAHLVDTGLNENVMNYV